MPAHPYLTDEELALLGQLYRQEQSESRLNLTLFLDAGIRPLLEQASQLELKMEIGDVTLHFPVSLDTRSHDEQAQVSTPDILTGDEAHPRAWRLPSPRELRLLEPSGRPLAADIRDLSIGGMRLLSRRCLFRRQQSRRVKLQLGDEQALWLRLQLVRQHRGRHFWLTAVRFELPVADRLALSDFVFRGFLQQMEGRQPSPSPGDDRPKGQD